MRAQSTWRVSAAAVRPAPALGQHVVDHLRRLIISGELQPGTHLVEANLSETFDVSRGPIRDALRLLETEGLVESRRRGVFVIGLSADDIDELYSLRQLIEVRAVSLCMEDHQRDFTAADRALAHMAQAARRQDSADFASADLEFHSVFYSLSGHRRLESVWLQYRPTFATMLSLTNAEDRDLGPTYLDHVDLLRSIAGRSSRTLELLDQHLEGSRQRMLAAYARHFPDTPTKELS